jgi:hypothetical protein
MSEQSDDATLSVQIANQFINVANARVQDRIRPDIVAAGLRHAAANFSAFVAAHAAAPDVAPEPLVEEFRQMLDYYLKLHGAKEDGTPLERLVAQVKAEQS